MVEIHFFIPLANNAGTPFTADHHAAFERYAAMRLGGLSKLPGEVSGQWVAGNTLYTDRLVQYVVALPSILHTAKLGAVLAFAARHYEQQSLYLRYAGHAELFMAPPRASKALPAAPEVASKTG